MLSGSFLRDRKWNIFNEGEEIYCPDFFTHCFLMRKCSCVVVLLLRGPGEDDDDGDGICGVGDRNVSLVHLHLQDGQVIKRLSRVCDERVSYRDLKTEGNGDDSAFVFARGDVVRSRDYSFCAEPLPLRPRHLQRLRRSMGPSPSC